MLGVVFGLVLMLLDELLALLFFEFLAFLVEGFSPTNFRPIKELRIGANTLGIMHFCVAEITYLNESRVVIVNRDFCDFMQVLFCTCICTTAISHLCFAFDPVRQFVYIFFCGFLFIKNEIDLKGLRIHDVILLGLKHFQDSLLAFFFGLHEFLDFLVNQLPVVNSHTDTPLNVLGYSQ